MHRRCCKMAMMKVAVLGVSKMWWRMNVVRSVVECSSCAMEVGLSSTMSASDGGARLMDSSMFRGDCYALVAVQFAIDACPEGFEGEGMMNCRVGQPCGVGKRG